MKILNFGSLNIDKVYSVESFVRAGETIGSTNYNEYAGGKGLNQSIALSKAGASVYHAGKIGYDGHSLKAALEESGVHTEYIYESNLSTGHAIIQVNEQGENCILIHGGANHDITEQEIEEIFLGFDQEDVLVIQNELNITSHVISQGNDKGMTIIFNPSPINESIKGIDLSKINYLIMNEIETLALSKKDDIEDGIVALLETYRNLKLIITLGAKGAIYVDRKFRYHQEAYKTSVVDTTAAGDTFLGYFVAVLLSSKEVKKAMELASRAASIAVSFEGASISIPALEEVVK